jgi:three-Cys-motif partner protein
VTDEEDRFLFDPSQLPPPALPDTEPKLRQATHPVWTENKARLIERYLAFFVYITRHGTYIDGFAAPQQPDKPDMWAAKLVLGTRPRRLRHFYLFDKDRAGTKLLKELKRSQPPRDPARHEPIREIIIRTGDCNRLIPQLLKSKVIGPREATFCLLDQRTSECRWSTVQALARYKKPRIEIFYFLAQHWLARSIAAARTLAKTAELTAWWGRPDWATLQSMSIDTRRDAFVTRFRELGYASVKAWPIYERPGAGGHVMYHMIHATDHPAAPLLMSRAYNKALGAPEPPEQLDLLFGLEPKSQNR